MSADPSTAPAWGIHLSKLWRLSGNPFPIDVKKIAIDFTKTKYPDPITQIADHSIAGIEGVLQQRSEMNCWYVLYNKNISVPGRINFTLAHELGHYLLHRKQKNDFRCGQKDLLTYDRKKEAQMEAEANRFASYLLMPIDDFRVQIDGNEVTADLLRHCSDRYKVSFTAATLKWLEFTNQSAMMVVSRDGFVLWSYPSTSASKSQIYLAPGSAIPQKVHDFHLNSAAMDGENIRRKVPAGVWHKEYVVTETAIFSDRFDWQIFLLQFPGMNTVQHDEDDSGDSFEFLKERSQGLHWKK